MAKRVSGALVLVAGVLVSCASVDDGASSSSTGDAITRADSLVRVRIDLVDRERETRSLLDAGFDVVEGSEQANALEIIGTTAEVERLRLLGYAPVTVAVGAPFDQLGADDRDHLQYPNLDAMLAQMHQIADQFPTLAKVVDVTAQLGTPPTAEGRHLFALKITHDVQHDADKPTYLLVSNHHARELGPPLVAMRAMQLFTSQYATDDRIRALVDKMEIWIAPTWNPDGLNYVHTGDHLWRKNRRPIGSGNFGVDQNRNYPFEWNTSCSGSTSPSSDTYKGPSAGSEPETQTMMAFSRDRHFTKVIDFHSYGRQVMSNYSCSNNALSAYFGALSTELSTRMGYGGNTRRPNGQGEHQDWENATLSNLSFLVEINDSFQPPFASAQTEVEQLIPGILWHLEQPTPVSGHVRDAATGAPLAAKMVVKEVAYTNGEGSESGGAFGRYQAYLPPGTYTLEFSLAGYRTESRSVTIAAGTELTVDVPLTHL